MRIIKQLHTGEFKMECPSCLNRFRAKSSDFKCPICEDLKNIQVAEIIEVNISDRFEIPEPHKESPVPYEIVELIPVDNEVTQAPTEILKKPSKKTK